MIARTNQQKKTPEQRPDLGSEQSARTNFPRERYVTLRAAILCLVLFLSGIGALIFETLWLRLSGLAFGNSVWTAALILSSFMAGLALGNTIAASSKFPRMRSGLRFYAVLEVIVAFFGCAIVFGLPFLARDDAMPVSLHESHVSGIVLAISRTAPQCPAA